MDVNTPDFLLLRSSPNNESEEEEQQEEQQERDGRSINDCTTTFGFFFACPSLITTQPQPNHNSKRGTQRTTFTTTTTARTTATHTSCRRITTSGQDRTGEPSMSATPQPDAATLLRKPLVVSRLPRPQAQCRRRSGESKMCSALPWTERSAQGQPKGG